MSFIGQKYQAGKRSVMTVVKNRYDINHLTAKGSLLVLAANR